MEAERRDKELRKLRLKYEIMARHEVNVRMSEINSFLEQRARDQVESEKKRDLVTESIQKDLADRLQQSREELLAIKQQMKGGGKTNRFRCQLINRVLLFFRYRERHLWSSEAA